MLHRVLGILRIVLVLLIGQSDDGTRVDLVAHLRIIVDGLELVTTDGLLVQGTGFDSDLSGVVEDPRGAGVVLSEARLRLTLYHMLHRVLGILRLIGIDLVVQINDIPLYVLTNC